MARSIKLVGLDCGSTTTSAIVACARVGVGALGRMEVSQIEPVFRSEMVFTPFVDDRIDIDSLDRYLDEWLAAAQSAPSEIFGGGALVTGLAAQRTNAAAVTRLIEARLADSVVATADDPCLESWLAFMGNCHALSMAHPELPILNLDIGGGTTNLALGVGGQVVATGCLMVGARHFQFVPGTYELTALSRQAAALLEHLHIERRAGDTLERGEVEAIVDWYFEFIEAAVEGRVEPLATPIGRLHAQVVGRWPAGTARPFSVTLSGGVGQLVYDYQRGIPCGGISQFGDMGGELATRIVAAPRLASLMATSTPEGLGRATVYGLLRHATAPSGATLYLPHPERLPLRHVPIVGRIGPESSDDELFRAVDLAARGAVAGCLQVDLREEDAAAVRGLGGRLGRAIESLPFPCDRTLVVLAAANVGKAFGNYVTQWGTLDVDLIVVDEVPPRDSQFVRLGRVCEGTVPISLYGMR